MSDIYNHLCSLGNDVHYALEELESAVRIAEEICGDEADPGGKDGWEEMSELARRLEKIRAELAAVVPESIQKAIADADAYLDEMADRADAASY